MVYARIRATKSPPLTPAARKKFEGVVAGAWKPFVSLSLRRFVQGAPYTTAGWFLVSSLEGTSNKSRTIVSRGTFRVCSRLAETLRLSSNRGNTIRNGFVREFRTYGMHFEARTSGRGGEGRKREKERERESEGERERNGREGKILRARAPAQSRFAFVATLEYG